VRVLAAPKHCTGQLSGSGGTPRRQGCVVRPKGAPMPRPTPHNSRTIARGFTEQATGNSQVGR
jgi:hypothetical protein